MRTASASTIAATGLEETFAFHADAANLGRVVPRGLISAVGDTALGPGRIVRVTLGRRPFAVRAQLQVREWEPPDMFMDAQEGGPVALWEHRHRFTPAGHGTRIEDEIRFALHPPWSMLEPLLVPAVRFLLRLKLARTRQALG